MTKEYITEVLQWAFKESGLTDHLKNQDIQLPYITMQEAISAAADKLASDALSLNSYQEKAQDTAQYPEEFRVIYPALGITGESGEVSDKIKKLIRDKGYTGGFDKISDEDKRDIALELGDTLWYVAAMAHDLGLPLQKVAELNIEKLAARKESGNIGGSGDHRGEGIQCSTACPSTDDYGCLGYAVCFLIIIMGWIFV